MYVFAPEESLAEVWANICSKGDERLPHAPLTRSHHYRHHRLPLIETLPLWLTLQLPANEGEEGWDNNLELCLHGIPEGGEPSSGQEWSNANLTGKGAEMQQRRRVAKSYSLYALFITLNASNQGCVIKNAL